MKFTLNTESLNQLSEVLESKCDGIRYGPEFCEWKIPSLRVLEKAYQAVKDAEKTFTYVIPILTNVGVDKIREHLEFLGDHRDIEVIIGDLGALNILKGYDLRLHLSRPRVYIPGRSPWDQITRMSNPPFFARRKVEKIFYQTSLNYVRSLDYYKKLGVVGADVDWIPKCFPHYKKIIKNGFRLALHTYAIPVAVTMRCHMARFLGEKEPSQCSVPCFTNAFDIEQKELEKEFIVNGNVVYRQVNSERRDIKKLRGIGVKEMVLPVGPVSKLRTTDEVNEAIAKLSGEA